MLFPHTTEEVSLCAKICHENNFPIIPFGTGTGLEGGVTAVKVRLVGSHFSLSLNCYI